MKMIVAVVLLAAFVVPAKMVAVGEISGKSNDAGLSLNMDVERAASTCRPKVVAPTTPGPARVCKNDMQDSSCKTWKSEGKCTSDMYKKFMRESCYQECGLCTDRDTTTTTTAEPARACKNGNGDSACAQWKGQGFCTSDMYKAFMKTSCYKACGYC